MQRRTFIKNTALCAVAVSASGFIRLQDNRYVGDCETTSDILGPFYRPDSPVRNNLVVPGGTGQLLQLSGIIKHKDCVTPYKNAKIELWHCDEKGVYDNESDAFLYRGTTYCDDKGRYTFNTILPVPYDVGNGHFRPAHFHLMITAPGYQPLVTQLYFVGDKNISKDSSASSPMAKRRILQMQTLNDGTKKVLYDVSMSQSLAADAAAIDKLTGTFTNEKDSSKKMEFFKKNDVMWVKNDLFGENLNYTGNNTFEFGGMPAGMYGRLKFTILSSGEVQLEHSFLEDDKIKHTEFYSKKK